MGDIESQLVLQFGSLSQESSVQPQKSILTWHVTLNFVRVVLRDAVLVRCGNHRG